MRTKPNGKKRKNTNKKQWREFLPGISHATAALYWVVRLILLFWDRFVQ